MGFSYLNNFYDEMKEKVELNHPVIMEAVDVVWLDIFFVCT